jgi:hypothetical protein
MDNVRGARSAEVFEAPLLLNQPDTCERKRMNIKRVIVLSLLLIFSLGSLALAGTPGQNDNRPRTERRENNNRTRRRENASENRGNWRRHRRRHRRHRHRPGTM